MIHREIADSNEKLCHKVQSMLQTAGYGLAPVERSRTGTRFVASGYECHPSAQSANTITVSYVTVVKNQWKLSHPAPEIRSMLEHSGFDIEEMRMGWRLRERTPN